MSRLRNEGIRPMAITRRTFAKTVLAAAAGIACPLRRLARRVIFRVRYAEVPSKGQYRGKVEPMTPEEIAKTGKWLG